MLVSPALHEPRRGAGAINDAIAGAAAAAYGIDKVLKVRINAG